MIQEITRETGKRMSTAKISHSKLENVGIYQITNIVNGKFYIGSSINLERRFKDHKKMLNRNLHCNKHLQRAWNTYGENKFNFEIVFNTDFENRLKIEQSLLDSYWGTEQCYNMAKDASSPSKGMIVSDETREKIRDKRKFQIMKSGFKLTNEHKEKLKGPRGKNSKMSESAKKRFENPEQRELIKQIGLSNKGKKYNCDRRGQMANGAKLTMDEVKLIRQLYIPYKTPAKKLAEQFGVSLRAVQNILNNISWTNL